MSSNSFLRLPQVKARTGLSRSTIYARIAQGSFPKPVPLGGARAVGWLESQVESWIQCQIDAASTEGSAAARTPSIR